MAQVAKSTYRYPRWAQKVVDAIDPLSIFVTDRDIELGIANNGWLCTFGLCTVRATGGGFCYFYLTKALIQLPTDPPGTVRRYDIPLDAQNNVIRLLDAGRKEEMKPGTYTLRAPKGRNQLGGKHLPTGEGKQTGPQRDKTKGHAMDTRHNLGRLVVAQSEGEA